MVPAAAQPPHPSKDPIPTGSELGTILASRSPCLGDSPHPGCGGGDLSPGCPQADRG